MQTAPDIEQHTTAQAFAAHLALVGKDIRQASSLNRFSNDTSVSGGSALWLTI